MLYLNHELLTSEGIINYFRKNLAHFKESSSSDKSAKLSQFKDKLKQTFLEDDLKTQAWPKNLDKDPRFNANYQKLKNILQILFAVNDGDDFDLVLKKLTSIEIKDWEHSADKFDELNALYGYFNNPNQKIRELFEELSISCRITIVFFEKNDTPEKNKIPVDDLAYEYAYKLMVLFINAKDDAIDKTKLYRSIYHFMKTKGDKNKKLYHDVLYNKFSPLPHASTIDDINGWQAFVSKVGCHSLSFWLHAQKIEEKIASSTPLSLKRAPRDLQEAKKMFLLTKYAYAMDDLSFANLCFQYQVPEMGFNKCLNFLDSGWPKKNSDSIPNLVIHGKGDAENLIWLKMPVTDKRALILGHITKCCQSLDGSAEQCVIDAVSLDDNALYVLIKPINKIHSDFIINGQINDKDYKIIGQSYVWKSIHDNICLDSIEFLANEISYNTIKSILSDFADQILKNYPEIFSVTLGRTTKTPENLFPHASITEIPLKGYTHGDSEYQYVIASRFLLNQSYHHFLNGFFYNAHYYSKAYLDYCLQLDKYSLNEFFEKLFSKNQLSSINKSFVNKHTAIDELISAVIAFRKLGILRSDFAQEDFIALIEQPQTSRKKLSEVYKGISLLFEVGLLIGELGREYIKILAGSSAPVNVARLLIRVEQMTQLSPNILTKLRMRLMERDNYFFVLAFQQLLDYRLHTGIHGEKNCALLINNYHSEYIYYEMNSLIKTAIFEGVQGNVNFEKLLLLDHNKDIQSLYSVFSAAKSAGLMNNQYGQQNFDSILNFTPSAYYDLSVSIDYLSSCGLLICEQGQKNFDLLIHHEDFKFINSAVKSLYQMKQLSQEKFNDVIHFSERNESVFHHGIIHFSERNESVFHHGIIHFSERNESVFHHESFFTCKPLDIDEEMPIKHQHCHLF